MKKKLVLIASILTATALLSACSSGVSEQDFKALENRVATLEKVSSTDTEETTPTTLSEANTDQQESTGTSITSKEGIETSFVSGGLIDNPKEVLNKDSEEGNYFVYTVVDWKYTGTESKYPMDFYSLSLTDGEIKVSGISFLDIDRVAEKLNLDGVKDLPSPLSPKESGKTLAVFKISEAAYKEADSWGLTFKEQNETIPVSF